MQRFPIFSINFSVDFASESGKRQSILVGFPWAESSEKGSWSTHSPARFRDGHALGVSNIESTIPQFGAQAIISPNTQK